MENVLLKNCLPLAELKQFMILEKNRVKIIDVRNKEEYDQNHIPNAIHLELAQIEKVDQLFHKKDIIVTVCGKGGGRSLEASQILKVLGFKNCYWLCCGTFGWE